MVNEGTPVPGASEKTLKVMEAALQHERFSDIVSKTQLSKATVHRILSTLLSYEFLSGDAVQGYRAGPRFLALAGAALDSVDISSYAQPIVDDLVREVDCTVHIGVVSGDEMVYAIRTDSSKPYKMRSRVGLSLPMHSSGMGKAVLATRTTEEVRALAQRTGLPARTGRTITDIDTLVSEIETVRSLGWALDNGENEAGTVCVSAAIFDATGRATHGLSISSIALEHPGDSISDLAPYAVDAAEQISRQLGCAPRCYGP